MAEDRVNVPALREGIKERVERMSSYETVYLRDLPALLAVAEAAQKAAAAMGSVDYPREMPEDWEMRLRSAQDALRAALARLDWGTTT